MGIAQSLANRAGSTWERLKGYVGWLVTDPDFIGARNDLASQWYALQEESRPYPISRSIRLPNQPPGYQPAPSSVATVQAAIDAFLDHWGLTQMLTWDLPGSPGADVARATSRGCPGDPQARTAPGPAAPLSPDRYGRPVAPDSATAGQPVHAMGLSPSMAGLPHFEVYGQMLEVDFLEETIRIAVRQATESAGSGDRHGVRHCRDYGAV